MISAAFEVIPQALALGAVFVVFCLVSTWHNKRINARQLQRMFAGNRRPDRTVVDPSGAYRSPHGEVGRSALGASPVLQENARRNLA